MFDLKNSKSFIYRIALPVLQALACVLMLPAMIFDDRMESASDILRNTSIAIQFLVLAGLGLKELLARKNRTGAYLYFGVIFIVAMFIIYIMNMYK